MMPTTDLPFRSVPAGQALHWWREGWRGFVRAPMAWVVLTLGFLAALIVVRVLPFGAVLSQWLGLPLFALGTVFAALLQRRVGAAPPGLVGAPDSEGAFADSMRFWKKRLVPLLQVSALVLLLGGAIGLLLAVAMGALFGMSLLSMRAWSQFMTPGVGMMAGMGAMAGGMFALVLLGLVGLFLLNLAFWFVGPLVLFAGARPWDAVRLSVRAGLANVGAVSLFTLLLVPIGFVAMLPFGLGLLALLPMLSAASFAAYDDVFDGVRAAG